MRFKELQNAYEVLSDKHERAWSVPHSYSIHSKRCQHIYTLYQVMCHAAALLSVPHGCQIIISLGCCYSLTSQALAIVSTFHKCQCIYSNWVYCNICLKCSACIPGHCLPELVLTLNVSSNCLCFHRYDSHRDAILRSGETHQAGGDGGVTPGQRPSDELDPFQYFTTSCYSGYNDGAKVHPQRMLVL